MKCTKRQRGFALPAALLLLLLLSAIAIGMVHMVQTEARVSGSDLDNTAAYYASEAAMEKMMADLARLYSEQQSPTVNEVAGLHNGRPMLEGAEYPEYSLTLDPSRSRVKPIDSGPHSGLSANLIPINLTVRGQGSARGEVKMIREVEVALIPVFQFGIFSDVDLAFHAGQRFDFGGRVHTNGDLFLAASSSGSLWFRNKVSAAGEVIRAEMINGKSTSSAGRTGPIYVPTLPTGCDSGNPSSTCRRLEMNEGSKVAGPESTDNSGWEELSLVTYGGQIISKGSGARKLELPFVKGGSDEIEIIQRPDIGESPSSSVGRSRLYNQAQIRVLLNDDMIDLPTGLGIELDNVPPYEAGGTLGSTDTAFAESNSGQQLIGGFLVVEARRNDGSYSDVTGEWLNLGIARENPDAILRFQTLRDNNNDGHPDVSNTSSNRRQGKKFQPINIYDPREGEVRDNWRGSSSRSCALGGLMSIIELDVDNLRRWLTGQTGLTGTQTEYLTQNGYIVYFSDRRGMLNDQGEYGFEDMINPHSSSGNPDGLLQDPEDVNDDGFLQTSGADNLGDGFGASNGDPTFRFSDCRSTSIRMAKVTGARHAIKLVNGSLGNLPARPDGSGGFTVASENPVYIQGDYNADAGFGSGFVAAAVIADAVTLLSSAWEDWTSFRHPAYPGYYTSRKASESWYRVAIAAGKNKAFPITGPLNHNQHYGLDGGTHNFMRLMERWTGRTLHYMGSLVSFYYSRQANGIFKCCNTVYRFPVRDFNFDEEFRDPSRLPPGTPRFQDLVNLDYQQVFHVTPESQ